MQKITLWILGAFMLSWTVGIACLFVALQFSPPRWSAAETGGALVAAAKSSTIYVLPPLLFLAARALTQAAVSIGIAGVTGFVWTVLTVAWWASSFSPVPWIGALRNLVLLLPASLVPTLIFYLLLGKR